MQDRIHTSLWTALMASLALACVHIAAAADDPLPSWHDGTLWAEQPMYFQLAFAFDRVKALAPHHPEW